MVTKVYKRLSNYNDIMSAITSCYYSL